MVNYPTAVKSDGILSGKNIMEISLGFYFACASSFDSILYCWGRSE
jgi:hypothetical protein